MSNVFFELCQLIPVPENVRYCARLLRDGAKTYIWEGRESGTPLNPSTFRHKYNEALESLGKVRILSPHSCRHTYVSQMQALGVDLATIQSIVGHANVDMTQHYLHVQQSIRQDAIDRFADAFGEKKAGFRPTRTAGVRQDHNSSPCVLGLQCIRLSSLKCRKKKDSGSEP